MVASPASSPIQTPSIVKGALSGFGSVGNDVMGVADPSYAKDLPQREGDLAMAKRLLSEAKFDTTKTYELFTTADVPAPANSPTTSSC